MAKSDSPLGDFRLVRPFTQMVNAMLEKLTVVLRQLGCNRKEEVRFGRLINNPRVTPIGLVKQYWHNNQTDWSGKHFLVVEDGSKISFQLTKDRKGLGYIGKSNKVGGFEVHSALLLDAADLSCYGLGAAQVYKTEPLPKDEKLTRRSIGEPDCVMPHHRRSGHAIGKSEGEYISLEYGLCFFSARD
jgi:hypothetical protein